MEDDTAAKAHLQVLHEIESEGHPRREAVKRWPMALLGLALGDISRGLPPSTIRIVWATTGRTLARYDYKPKDGDTPIWHYNQLCEDLDSLSLGAFLRKHSLPYPTGTGL